MIDVKEHFYQDDPGQGHPDGRTVLKDVNYFFLGNGFIQAAVQVAPCGPGTPIGLLIMNPQVLGQKRQALTFDPKRGLAQTMILLAAAATPLPLERETLKAEWQADSPVPFVTVRWQTSGFPVAERFYCPHHEAPVLLRDVTVRNTAGSAAALHLKTGVGSQRADVDLTIPPKKEITVTLKYTLNGDGTRVLLERDSGTGIGAAWQYYWADRTAVVFDSPLLNRYFKAAAFQLPAAISHTGIMDGSIWQYNHEWLRDQAMVTVGLTLSGHHRLAARMLERLISRFVGPEGDTVDSGVKRDAEEVELDQNGALLYALHQYVRWTADTDIVRRNWRKIKITAQFPLREAFRHAPSGLLANTREYWERHRAFGIQKGMELTHQLFTVLGLRAAAALARLISQEEQAGRWEREAQMLQQAMLDSPYRLLDQRGFFKRRGLDGTVQETIEPLPESQLPPGVPLTAGGKHHLNPDTSCVLPIVLGLVPPDSELAQKTLAQMETLWNQAWQDGGYGRYHVGSEPDSPGAWAFPSLFVARAYAETGDLARVWRVLEWLSRVPGGVSGAWFEYYGKRLAPPFPQQGIVPWTWAEMLMLLVHHIMGIRPQDDRLVIRPRLLPGLQRIEGHFPLRGHRLSIKITRAQKGEPSHFSANTPLLHTDQSEAHLPYPPHDLHLTAHLQPNNANTSMNLNFFG